MNETPGRNDPVSTGVNWTHFLFSGILLLVSMIIYQSSQAAGLRREVDQARRENTALRASLAKSDADLRSALDGFHAELDRVHAQLDSVHAETGQDLADAQAAAVRHADELVGQLEKKRRQQEEQERRLTAELDRVKQSADETSSRLNGISSTVGSMTNAVQSVRSSESQTRGDLGSVSGHVATNAAAIQTLHDRGDTHVYEFTLAKSDGMRRIGDIQVSLSRADPKRNRFTLQILAGDQKVEKRDRSVNEPIQFYIPGKDRYLYELVIDEIGKDTVKGYLAAPKLTLANKGPAN